MSRDAGHSGSEAAGRSEQGGTSTADRLAILDAIARYSFAFDRQNADQWAALFMPSGVFEVYLHGASQPSTRYVGQEELHAFAQDSFTRRLLGARIRHFQPNTLFDELTETTARTTTMVMITQIGSREEHPRLALTGHYEDQWMKLGASWKLARRTLRSDQRPSF